MSHSVPSSPPSHFTVLLLMFRATCGPFLGPGCVFDLFASSRTVPAASLESENAASTPPTPPPKCCREGPETVLVPAPEAELGQVWREPQETNPFKTFLQTSFASVGLSTKVSPVPGGGEEMQECSAPGTGLFVSLPDQLL